MQTNNEDTKFIQLMIWVESNLAEVYLSLEPMFLLIIGILFAGEILELYHQPSITLDNYKLLILPVLGILSTIFRFRVRKKRRRASVKSKKI